MNQNPRYGFRKSKAVKTLCGAVLGLSLTVGTQALVKADEASEASASTPASSAVSSATAITAEDTAFVAASAPAPVAVATTDTATSTSSGQVAQVVAQQAEALSAPSTTSDAPEITTTAVVTPASTTTAVTETSAATASATVQATTSNPSLATSASDVTTSSSTSTSSQTAASATADTPISSVASQSAASASKVSQNSTALSQANTASSKNSDHSTGKTVTTLSTQVSSAQTTDDKTSTSHSSAMAQAQNGKTEKKEEKKATTASQDGKYIQIKYDQPLPDATNVLFAVWSQNKEQDDIKWYWGDKTGAAKVDLSQQHREYGLYNIHTYLQSTITGILTGQNAITLDVKKSEVKVGIQKQKAGSYQVTVSNVGSDLNDILLPTWSDNKGQDDIKWYGTTRGNTTTYTANISITDHDYETGKYNVHVYGNSAISGKLEGLQASGFTESARNVKANILSKTKDSFTVTLTDVPEYFNGVYLPTWSQNKGQDDIKWHRSTKAGTTTYTADIKIEDHNYETGTYNVHAYGQGKTGKLYGLVGKQHTVAALISNATISLSNVNQAAGTYTVNVNELSDGKAIKEISIAVWSDKDQGNMHWYTVNPSAAVSATGININNHYYKAGTYQTHVYITYKDGSRTGHVQGLTQLQSNVKSQIIKVLETAGHEMGTVMGSNAHHQIVNEYNSVWPRPFNYTVQYWDDWCDIFTTTIFQRAGLSNLIGRECGVERHIQIFKSLGIWNENGQATPKAGDIITYNWNENHSNNNGFADHIGIVEKVENGYIYTIEGNTITSDNSTRRVARKAIQIGHGQIRGFATPKYN